MIFKEVSTTTHEVTEALESHLKKLLEKCQNFLVCPESNPQYMGQVAAYMGWQTDG